MCLVRSATQVSGPGRSMSLQLTLVHRPLEPELGVRKSPRRIGLVVQRDAGPKRHGEIAGRPGSGGRLRGSRCRVITSVAIRPKTGCIARAASVWQCKYYGNTGKRWMPTRLPSTFSKNLTLESVKGVSGPNFGGTSRDTLIARFTNPRGLGIRMA